MAPSIFHLITERASHNSIFLLKKVVYIENMDSFVAITRVHGSCYETRPCQHECEIVLNNGAKTTQLISGLIISRYPNAIKHSTDLLEHFLEYNPELQSYINERKVKANKAAQIELVELYKTNYQKRVQNACENVMSFLLTLKSISSLLKKAVSAGYDGVCLTNSIDVAFLEENELDLVKNMIDTKLEEEGIKDIVLVSIRQSIDIYLDLPRLKLNKKGKLQMISYPAQK